MKKEEIMKKITSLALSIVTAFTLLILPLGMTTGVASAQEINPTPGTYSYGSTSEFSPYVALSSSGSLAPTGDSQVYGYGAVALLVLIGTGLISFSKKIKQSN